MFNNLKKVLYYQKTQLLFEKGLKEGSIVPFDEAIYEKMNNTYISCIPVSMYIKYLKPIGPIGKCHDRSLFMFFCFGDALYVKGDSKELELEYGKEDDSHDWVEMGDYVYDPSLNLRFKKDIYYQMYCPTNVCKYSKDDYIKKNKDFYEEVKNTTLQDFKPNGRKRASLCLIAPFLHGIAEIINNKEFKRDVCNYLDSVQYDDVQIFDEINIKIKFKK